jgi:hypothetical protein
MGENCQLGFMRGKLRQGLQKWELKSAHRVWQSDTAEFLDASENQKVDGGDSTFAGC